MSAILLNGEGVTALSLTLPLQGPWHADVGLLPSSPIPSGKVRLEVFGTTYVGTVVRSGETKLQPSARIVGGAGGMGKVLPPRAYRGTDAHLPLVEILRAAGETLSPSSASLSRRLPFFVRMEGRASEALSSLLEVAGIPSWRILADGTLWVGAESWPETKMADWSVLSRDPHLGRHDLHAEEPCVFPGETLNGIRILRVEHKFTTARLVTTVVTG